MSNRSAKYALMILAPLMLWSMVVSGTYTSARDAELVCAARGGEWVQGDSKPMMPVYGECE